ncbi:MAG TPA: protein kinase, partial [Pyrinomonadaceae bacterium]
MNDQFTGQILANKYRVDSVLRDDDLGKIYRATHVSMEKPVTVKILAPALAVDESIVRRFSAEARGVSQIAHPNILNVNDFGADNGAVYIVYEGAPGATLKEAIRAEGRFSIERAVNIARQIASALAAAHAAGMIHQNLSADNILLARTANNAEMVKLTGFAAESNTRELFDENGQNANIEYLSPEQCADTGAIDERSDIYGLGVVLYEMLAGEVPFSGRTPTEIMLKSSAEPPAPLAAFRQDLPAEIEPIVLQAMAKNPEMRFHTMDEFAAALARVSRNHGEQETVVVPQTGESPEPSNNIWKTAFVVLAGISLLAIGLIYATSVKQTDPATQMQTDANGQPVQPINPATGTDEQALSNLAAGVPEIIANSNMMAMPPGAVVPGGDGYNPWGGSGPPPGAPIAPPGNYIMIDPNNPTSPFTTDGNGIYLVPVPANTVINANVKPTPTPRGNAASANASATPATNTAPKPTPQTTPAAKPSPQPTAKPAEQPKASPPAAT